MKSNLLYLALFFLLLFFSAKSDGNDIIWLWNEVPYIPVILVGMAILCIVLHLFLRGLKNAKNESLMN